MNLRLIVLLWAAVMVVAVPRPGIGGCGDVNANGSVTTADALAILRVAVGQEVALTCNDAIPLQTGQAGCWNSTGASISCAGTAQDAALKKGVPFQYVDNGDGTITDLSTQLTWEKLGAAGSVHDINYAGTWPDAFLKVATMNGSNFAGHDDWRLPNVRELLTLVDYGIDTSSGRSMTPSVFDHDCEVGCTVATCSCTAQADYWTSTTQTNETSSAWAVSFRDGVSFYAGKLLLAPVRAVRGG